MKNRVFCKFMSHRMKGFSDDLGPVFSNLNFLICLFASANCAINIRFCYSNKSTCRTKPSVASPKSSIFLSTFLNAA